jgi:hypothetical protein
MAALDEARTAIQRARKAFDDALRQDSAVIGQDTAAALAHFSEEIESLVGVGNALAARQYPAEADTVYAAAQLLEDSTLSLQGAARRGAPRSRIQQLRMADLLAHAGHSAAAEQLYNSALASGVPGIQIPAETWNDACWYGALFGEPAAVLGVCEKAANLADRYNAGMIRDSRGVASVLANRNLAAATEDFDAYVAWARMYGQSYRQADRRAFWATRLRAGANPLLGQPVLDSLRSENRSVVDAARRGLIDEYTRPIDPEESLIQLMTKWALEPEILDYLERNQRPLCEMADTLPVAGCDEAWAGGTLEGMDGILSNSCSERLKRLKRLDFLAEIFITDSAGFNVCASNMTTDYYQGEEDWWRSAKVWFPRAPVSRSGMERDQSAGEWAYVVYTAIRDPRSKELLGVMKAVFKHELGLGTSGSRGLSFLQSDPALPTAPTP